MLTVSSDILGATQERKKRQNDVIHAKEVKKSLEVATLEMNLLALKEENKTDRQISVADSRLMVQRYRRQGDLQSPQTTSGLLSRFMESNQ